VVCENFAFQKVEKQDPKLEWRGFKAEKMNMDTLLANVAPEKRGYLSGSGKMESEGTMQGFSPEARAKNMRVKATGSISDGKIQNVPMAKEIGDLIGVPELENITFKEFSTDLSSAAEGIQVKAVEILGDLQRIRFNGLVGYDNSLNLPLLLGLGGKLREKATLQKFASYLQDDDKGYLSFPSPFTVSGNASKPKVQIDLGSETLVNLGLGVLEKELEKRGGAGSPELQQGLDVLKKNPAEAENVLGDMLNKKLEKKAERAEKKKEKASKTPKPTPAADTPSDGGVTATPTPVKDAARETPAPTPAGQSSKQTPVPGKATPTPAKSAPGTGKAVPTPVPAKATPAPAAEKATPTPQPTPAPAKATPAPAGAEASKATPVPVAGKKAPAADKADAASKKKAKASGEGKMRTRPLPPRRERWIPARRLRNKTV